MPSAATDALKRAADIAVRAGANVLTVPGLDDLMSGKVAINAMRPVDIEDLLGREPVQIDSNEVQAMITQKTALITGAGGSIGSELCRQLARFAPARLVLVEASEFALYNIEQWFRVHRPDVQIVPLAGDVKDALQSIPEDFRLAVYLADVEGFAYQEIADIMKTPIGTVMSRLHRGRRMLRDLLADYAKERGIDVAATGAKK